MSTRGALAINARVEIQNVSRTVGGTAVRDLTQAGAAPDMTRGFVAGRVVRIEKVARLDVSGN